MPTQAKVEQVAEIKTLFEESAGCWLVDARGLTVKEVQELRVDIRNSGGHMHVFKNRLAMRALDELGLPTMEDVLAGPTAFVFCDTDIAAPAKAVKTFMKEHEALEMKGGLVDGATVSVADAMKIADLPSTTELVGQLLSVLQAPLTGVLRVCNAPVESLARAVSAIAEQKEAA